MSHHAIAIDGPAGAGKSTIAKRVAKELNFIYVDTGAMYRALAIHMLRAGVRLDDVRHAMDGDIPQVEAALPSAEISLRFEDGKQQVFLNGENVTESLRTQEVGDMASAVSTNEKARARLVALQQKLAENADVVMDGRDIGTVVLPDADLKIYLTATSAERARRRFLELQEKGEEGDLAEIQKEIEERDHRDMTRAHSPLKKADGAVEIDSSQMSIDEVAARVLELYGVSGRVES